MQYTHDFTDTAFYERAWDLLVEHAGASRDPYQKDIFVHAYCQREHKAYEYRFGGVFGFGGKFWRNDRRFYVSYYQEDETPKMRVAEAKVNALLAALAEELHPNPYGPMV